MARATKDSVQRAVEGPDYDSALAIINGRLAKAKEAQSTASGNASQAWGDIEKLGVNKRGAQMFSRVQAIEDDAERQDQLRTFFELCKREGIGLEVDLVDQAQGKTEHPVPAATAPTRMADGPDAPMATAAETAALADGADDDADKPGAKLDEKPGNVVGIEKARQHLGGDAKPRGRSKPVPDATS